MVEEMSVQRKPLMTFSKPHFIVNQTQIYLSRSKSKSQKQITIFENLQIKFYIWTSIREVRLVLWKNKLTVQCQKKTVKSWYKYVYNFCRMWFLLPPLYKMPKKEEILTLKQNQNMSGTESFISTSISHEAASEKYWYNN